MDDFHKENTIPPIASDKNINPSLNIPKNIGIYKIESLFDKGGMSLLYLATNQETNEPAIIKVLPEKYRSNKEVEARFLREAEIIAMTNHPNIIKLYGQGEWEGGLYIAIEFLQGISLRQYILQKHIPLRKAIEIIIEIAYALCHLHMHGVIHRDLKPENIIVPENQPLKVIDFGIAQLLTEEPKKETEGKPRFLGTPIYMSPEQKDHPESVSYPSDIYSLAIIAYELILGKLSLGQLHLGLMPKGTRKILAKALQTDPKLRYQDVVDFIADMSAYLNSDAIKEEQNIGDQISELSLNLINTQKILLQENPPHFAGLEIGIATHKETTPSGIQQSLYQDFFEIANDAYGIIVTDSSLKNQESFVYTAATRGMIRALCRLTTKPDELITLLNDLIVGDSLKHRLSLNYMTIEPKENLLQYICCGQGQLFFLSSDSNKPEKIINQNPWIGVEQMAEFSSISHPFQIGDSLLMGSFSGAILNENQEFLSQEIMKSMMENAGLPAEIQTGNILKRLKFIFSKVIYNSVVSLIVVKRVS